MNQSPQNAADLLAKLEGAIAPRRRMITAYSGGIDSTLVAAAARRALGKANAPAAIGDSASLPRHEFEQACAIAAQLDLELVTVTPDEQADANYQANDGQRCYFCKTHLYQSLHDLAAAHAIRFIANGTNVDDLGDHRPGLVAASEAQIVSPLVEAGFGKAQVREVAQYLELPNWDKPAAACLASRLPYGTAVTPQRLAQVEQAETVLRELGFTGCRVRHHETVARIELPWQQVERMMEPSVREGVIAGLKAAGYTFIALDLEGFRSGSGNVLLTSLTINESRQR